MNTEVYTRYKKIFEMLEYKKFTFLWAFKKHQCGAYNVLFEKHVE